MYLQNIRLLQKYASVIILREMPPENNSNRVAAENHIMGTENKKSRILMKAYLWLKDRDQVHLCCMFIKIIILINIVFV